MVSGVYVMNRLAYAGWATLTMRSYYELDSQDARKRYFSPSGRVANYPYYVAYCNRNGYTPDAPPPGYTAPKTNSGNMALAGVGFMATFFWFLGGIMAGGTGRGRQPGS